MWRLVASLFTFFVPGAGHALAGRPGRALVWFVLGVGVMAGTLAWPPILLGMLPIRLVALVDLLIVTRRGVAPRAIHWGLTGALFAAGLAAVVLIRLYIAEGFQIPSAGMSPTLVVGDHIIARKLGYAPARGDVVVFRYPPDPTKDFVQRVVALGGQTVAVRGQILYVDGVAASLHAVGPTAFWSRDDATGAWRREESFELEETAGGRSYRVLGARVDGGASATDFPGARGCTAVGMQEAPGSQPAACLVPRGAVFVLGDNRLSSSDSRVWGAVEEKLIRGGVVGISWSNMDDQVAWERFGRIR